MRWESRKKPRDEGGRLEKAGYTACRGKRTWCPSVDGLPFDSYVEKGVLADLGGKLQEMGKDVLWDNIVDDFGNGEAVYAVPMVFQLPVFSGDSEKLEHIKTLSDLADVLEQEKQAEGKSLMGLFNPEDILSVLGLPNANQWLKDGALDKAALTDFLTQCKRIYEANLKVFLRKKSKSRFRCCRILCLLCRTEPTVCICIRSTVRTAVLFRQQAHRDFLTVQECSAAMFIRC